MSTPVIKAKECIRRRWGRDCLMLHTLTKAGFLVQETVGSKQSEFLYNTGCPKKNSTLLFENSKKTNSLTSLALLVLNC